MFDLLQGHATVLPRESCNVWPNELTDQGQGNMPVVREIDVSLGRGEIAKVV